MQQTITDNPIAELAEALEKLDFEFDQVRYAEKALAEVKAKYESARQRVSQAYMPAYEAAEQMGEKLGSHFQRGKSLITFDEEGCISVVEFECQYTYQLRKWLEPKPQAADPQDGA